MVHRETGIGWGTLTYHLKVLQEQGRVRVIDWGRRRMLAPAELPKAQARWLIALQEPESEQILDTVVDAPDVGIAEISARTGVSRKVVRRHLDHLEDVGLVSNNGGGNTHFRADKRAVDWVRRHLGLAPDDAEE